MAAALTSIGHVPPSPIGRAVTPAQRGFFAAIPKVELHCHLLGAIRRGTFADLAARAGAPFAAAEIDAFYARSGKPVGVLHILRALETTLLRTPDDFRRITREYLEDAAAENVRHAEFSWNPTGTMRAGHLAYADALEGILAGIADAQAASGISALFVAAIDREAGAAAAVAMVETVLAHPHPRVAGIGIDYRETDWPPELFAAAYAGARDGGLRLTAHAGEFGTPWTNVATAVAALGVERIDHGYTVVDNPALAEDLAERGLLFTIVPTNSYYLRTLPPERWALDHPIRRMAALGLKLHPNTDDPTLHHVSPAGCWELLYSHLGFTLAELRAMMLNGVEGCWAAEDAKAGWRGAWPAAFDAARTAADWDDAHQAP